MLRVFAISSCSTHKNPSAKFFRSLIAWLVPHQANKRIIDATANRMVLSQEKVMLNIQRYGNTTAAIIPLCHWDYKHEINEGDLIALVAFGGGFTWGATLIKWEY